MYVIWRKRKREHYAGFHEVGEVRLTPIIAQSRRVSGGPRQEHIACLPSIIESDIDEKGCVGFWDAVEEKLARLANRIPPEEAAKIRAALSKVAPIPDPKYAEERRAYVEAVLGGVAKALSPDPEATRKTNKAIHTFRDSLKTGERCADCGEKLETVYRNRTGPEQGSDVIRPSSSG